MRIAGIICEYNPFHNGHKYQIDLLKKDFDAVVCVMSGSFVQRGDVAAFDKWTRTNAALQSGCDLIVELPVQYALSSAQGFAKGAIDILSATGIIDVISFGSECGDIEKLKKAADIMLFETDEVSEKIKEFLRDGYSFPAAREMAYKDKIDDELLCQPNNILALEYIMELNKRDSHILPITHKRSDSGYHSNEVTNEFASATKIRSMIENGEDFSPYVPFDYSGYETYNINRLSGIFRYLLISKGKDAFFGVPDMETGLDNRFVQNSDKESISEIIDAVKTKRYTRTRLQRIVLNTILGIKETDAKPEYIRILGMSQRGMEILSMMKKTAIYPVVNKVADFKNDSIKKDILATDIAAMCTNGKIEYGRDYYTSPVIL